MQLVEITCINGVDMRCEQNPVIGAFLSNPEEFF